MILSIFTRLKDDLARRERQRIARRKLADDVAVRKAMVGVPYLKRRNAALKATRP